MLFFTLVFVLQTEVRNVGCINKDGTIDCKAYTFYILQSLRSALRWQDIFVTKSQRYSDPRAKLLSL